MQDVRAAMLLAATLVGCGGQLVVDAAPATCSEDGCECLSLAGCGGGMSCVDGACRDLGGCSVLSPEGRCLDGRSCHAGVCATGPWCDGCTEACDTGNCIPLADTNRCSSSRPEGLCAVGSTCVGGRCVLLQGENLCSTERPQGLCPDGAGCDGGTCSPLADRPCGEEHSDGLCGGGMRCEAGVCRRQPCGPESPAGDCPAGERCTPSGCLTDGTCAADLDCSPYEICEAGFCQRDRACAGDGDCLEHERCGVAGSCLVLGRCSDDLDCDAAERCSTTGVCLDPGRCAASGDCPGGRCTSGGYCLDEGRCTMLRDCPPGHACADGTCIADGIPCTTNVADPAACPPGELCCGTGQRCSSAGTCIGQGRCVDDTDCLAGSTACIDYVCMSSEPCGSTCPTGSYCSLADACVATDRCVFDADCDGGSICTAVYECRVGSACGSVEIEIEQVIPNVLLVLDRSGSMNFCTEDTTTRWDDARAAVLGFAAAHAADLRLGLVTYPHTCDDASCSAPCDYLACTSSCPYFDCVAGDLDVDVADGSLGAIEARLHELSPGGSTPTSPTLRRILADPVGFGLPDADDPLVRKNFVLLVTDGEANCDGPTAPANVNLVLDALRALPSPITTYVVGFAFDTVRPSLNCHAVHGGAPRCLGVTEDDCATHPTPCYYEARDQFSLTAAFDDIISRLIPCDFALDQPPEDPTKLYVYFDYGPDLVALPRDASHIWGWDYDELTNQVSFFGSACQEIKREVVKPRVIYGCGEGGF